MMDIINISDNEINYLIEKGILDRSEKVHPHQFGLLGQHLQKQPFLAKRLGITITPEVYQWLRNHVKAQVIFKYQQHFENIVNYLDKFCIDEHAKRTYLSTLLPEFHKKIGDDLYAVYKNETNWKHATFSAFTKEDYFELADTGNIAKLKDNEHIKTWIEIETTEEVIEYIKIKHQEICNRNDDIPDPLLFENQVEEYHKKQLNKEMMFEIIGNMAPFANPDDLSEYFQLGIVEWAGKEPLTDWEMEWNDWWDNIRVNQNLADKFLKQLEHIVFTRSDNDSKKLVKDIIDECKIICYDETSQKSFIDKKIKELYNSIKDIRLVGSGIGAKKRIPNETPLDVFKEFAETSKIKAIPNQLPGFSEWVEAATRLKAIEGLKTKLQKSKTENRTKKVLKSYTWQSNPDKELPELHKKMIDAEVIAKDTDPENFKNVFKGQPLTEITPVKWLRTPVLLAYFIEKIRSKINADDSFAVWVKAEKCFFVEKKSALRNIADGYQDNKTRKPKHHTIIDDLF